MLKRLLFLLLFAGVLAEATWAQEEPIPPRRSRAMKVGLFAGYTPGLLFVNTDPINSMITANNGAALTNGGIYLNGGGGAIYIMILPNLRVGFAGASGSTSESNVLNNVRRDTELSVGYAGPTFEYVVPIVDRLDLSMGGLIGWGNTTITLKQDLGGAKTWADEWARFGSGNYEGRADGQVVDITRTMSGSFLVLLPSVNLEYAPLSWLAFRVGVSYSAMVAASWTLDGKYDLNGVPSDVNGSGFMINGGILLGTF